ncbi:hypothetical protein N8192_00440 [bacterium]|nr:hypothetical protein [bacterium]
MVNVQVMDEGTVATRNGGTTQLALASTVDAIFISGLHFYKVGTTIYDAAGASLGITQTGDQLRAAAAPAIGVTDDLVFFPEAMKKVYLGTVSDWGIRVTPAAPTAADASIVGSLTGNYTYKISFYASATHTESALSPVSNNVNIVGSEINVTLPVVCADTQVDMINIYRTQGGITGAWYFVDSVALGTAVYLDIIGDTGLGDQVNDNLIPPPTCNVAGRYKQVMVIADVAVNPRYAYPSNSSTPEDFDSTVLEQVMDAGDTAVFGIEMGDYWVVFGRRGIYFFQQDTSGIIYTAKVISGKGTTSGNSISMGDAGVYFQSEDGVYVLSGANITKVSDNIDGLFRGKDRGGMSLIADNTKTSGDFIGGRYYLTYPGIDGQQHTAIFNERKNRWKHFTGWNYTVPPDSGVLPIVGLDGSVMQADFVSLDDDGNSIYSELGFNLQSPMTALMEIRNFRVGLASAGTVTVDFYDDTTLMYSVDLVAPAFDKSYLKYSLPLGIYFLQPEVRMHSDSAFTLKMFEANVNYVRKYEADLTRQQSTLDTSQTSGGNQ